MAEETNKETIAGMDEENKEDTSKQGSDQAENGGPKKEEAGKQEQKDQSGAKGCQKDGKDTGDPEAKDTGDGEVVDGIFTQKEEGTKKGFFKRKKDKKDELIEDLNDKIKRQMAEFDNFRKRTEKEKSQMFDLGAKSVIEKILPVIDNFERGLAQATDHEDPFVQGMDKIYKSMLQELEGIGVKPIEAEGKEFDPNLHNAVMHCEDDSVGDNIVVQELQKGYTYHDNVVRHSMVKVAN